MRIEDTGENQIKIYGEYGSCVFDTKNEKVIEVEKLGTEQGYVFKSSYIFGRYDSLPCYIGELYEEGKYDTRESIFKDTKELYPYENNEVIEELANFCFEIIDWQSPSSYLEELDYQDLRLAKERHPRTKDNLILTSLELESFGYTYQGMIGIKRELAKSMYYRGYCTYILFSDDTEDRVERREDLLLKDVLYGVELDDFSNYLNGWLNIETVKGINENGLD